MTYEIQPPPAMMNPSAEAPQVAVLILTHNHENYIGACLESILRSALKRYHIWVLDGGSTDATPDVVADIARKTGNITLLRQPPNGGRTSDYSQRLIDESTGDYLVLMSGDDLFGPTDGIERAIAALETTPDLALVIPRMVYLMQDPVRTAPSCHEAGLLTALRSGDADMVLQHHLYRTVSRIFLQAMVLRRSDVEAFGGFDTKMLADDFAFVLRLFRYLSETGRTFRFDESSIWLYRVHASNVHRDPVRQFTLIAEVVAQYVPEDARRHFHWDAMIIENHAQLAAIQAKAVDLLGKADAMRALRPTIRPTARAASRRGDVRLICRLLLGKGVPLLQRVTAARYLPKAMVRGLMK